MFVVVGSKNPNKHRQIHRSIETQDKSGACSGRRVIQGRSGPDDVFGYSTCTPGVCVSHIRWSGCSYGPTNRVVPRNTSSCSTAISIENLIRFLQDHRPFRDALPNLRRNQAASSSGPVRLPLPPATPVDEDIDIDIDKQAKPITADNRHKITLK